MSSDESNSKDSLKQTIEVPKKLNGFKERNMLKTNGSNIILTGAVTPILAKN